MTSSTSWNITVSCPFDSIIVVVIFYGRNRIRRSLNLDKSNERISMGLSVLLCFQDVQSSRSNCIWHPDSNILDNSGMAFKEVSVLFEQKKLKYFTNDKTCTTSGRNLNYEPLFLVSKRLSWKRHKNNATMMALLRLMETYFTRLALSGTV